VVIIEGKGAIMGVNLGCPIATNGTMGLCFIVVRERRTLPTLLWEDLFRIILVLAILKKCTVNNHGVSALYRGGGAGG